MQEVPLIADFKVIIAGQEIQLIPLGYCACGCGRKTAIAKQSSTKKRHVNGQPFKFIHGHHKGNWKSGFYFDKDGYKLILMPNHPRARARCGYVLEHIIKAEKALGKPLPPGAEIHHLNGTRNTGPLVICQDRAYHKLLHRRANALRKKQLQSDPL